MSGIVLWTGASPVDGSPLVCIATLGSRNRKTGAMAQTWIMRADVAPHVAVATGMDVACCGMCPLRPHMAGHGVRCYVRTSDAPLSVWRAYHRGAYPVAGTDQHARLLAKVHAAGVRAGSYGDPAMVPPAVWAALPVATGYTHQWRAPWAQAHAAWCMASCDGPGDVAEARAAGWRTFEVVRPGSVPSGVAVQCPATTHDVQCVDCRLCGGQQRQGRSVWIEAHGATARCEGPAIPQLSGKGSLRVWGAGASHAALLVDKPAGG